MLPFTAPPSERTPLVDRGVDKPLLCGQCLLCVSDEFLLLILFVLFIINLVLTDGTAGLVAWLGSWFTFMVADLFLGMACLGTGMWIFVYNIAVVYEHPNLSCRGFLLVYCCGVVFAVVQLVTANWLLVSLSVWHGLEVAKIHHIPVAVGMLRAMWGCVWRPWWLLLYALPLVLTGSEQVASLKCEWFEWRQIIIGSVFWFCVFTYGHAQNFVQQNSSDLEAYRIIHRSGLLLYLYVGWVTYSSVLCTSAPIARFASFLLQVTRQIGVLMCGGKSQIRVEEWAVAFVFMWLAARLLWLGSGLDQLKVRWKMEERLRFAMDNPFVAKLEKDFGQADPSSQVTSTSPLLQVEGGMPMNVDSLNERQKMLLDARRQLLWDVPSNFAMQISRESIVETSCKNLFDASAMELCSHWLSVEYVGEAGKDDGGVFRDWLDAFAGALADGAGDVVGSSLFTLAPDQTLVPRPVRDNDAEKFRDLLSVGKFIALVTLRERPVPLSFSVAVCKCFLQVPVGMSDVHGLDPDFYRLRIEPLLGVNGVKEMAELCGVPLTFMSAASELCPSKELCPGGAEKLVTEENKMEYIRLLAEDYAFGSFRREMQCMQEGFYEVLPLGILEALAITPTELSMMISGIAAIDASDWRTHSDSGSTLIDSWFWEIVA